MNDLSPTVRSTTPTTVPPWGLPILGIRALGTCWSGGMVDAQVTFRGMVAPSMKRAGVENCNRSLCRRQGVSRTSLMYPTSTYQNSMRMGSNPISSTNTLTAFTHPIGQDVGPVVGMRVLEKNQLCRQWGDLLRGSAAGFGTSENRILSHPVLLCGQRTIGRQKTKGYPSICFPHRTNNNLPVRPRWPL